MFQVSARRIGVAASPRIREPTPSFRNTPARHAIEGHRIYCGGGAEFRDYDTLYREGETISRVMAPFVTGQPHRIGALDAALEYICSHAGVWRATGWEIVQHFLAQQP